MVSKLPESVYGQDEIEIIDKELLFKGFFQMVRYHFRHQRFDGSWSRQIDREMFVRGRAAALLPYDAKRDQVVLIEQIRVGALEHENPWQFEIVAGIMDKAESAEEIVRRESVEEAGVEVGCTEFITSYYPSSGGCNEKIDVFIGDVDASQAKGIHGLLEEDEDIKVHVVSRSDAYAMVKSGQIENGATIIALQWLQLNIDEIRSKWC